MSDHFTSILYWDPTGSHINMYIDDSRDDSSSRGPSLQDRIVHKIKMWIFLFLLFLNLNPCMGAAPTSTKTPPPYISLTDNLNEPKNVGWCLDLQGWGKSIKFTDMQVHSCKDSGGDVNFFPANGMIKGAADADSHCVKVQKAETGAGLDAPTCDTSDPLQKFVYCTDGTIRTNENLCLVAGETIHKAGSWSARDLAIEDCEKATESLRQWSYTEIGGNRVDHGTHNCSTKPACTAGCSSPVKSSGHRVQQRLPLLVAVGLAFFVSW